MGMHHCLDPFQKVVRRLSLCSSPLISRKQFSQHIAWTGDCRHVYGWRSQAFHSVELRAFPALRKFCRSMRMRHYRNGRGYVSVNGKGQLSIVWAWSGRLQSVLVPIHFGRYSVGQVLLPALPIASSRWVLGRDWSPRQIDVWCEVESVWVGQCLFQS